MRILKNPNDSREYLNAMGYLIEAAKVAENATCKRAKYGTVVVKNGKIIGSGFNSPPGNNEKLRRCDRPKSEYNNKVTDKTCCIHAEQRAIMDALKNFSDELPGSVLYFARVNTAGEIIPSQELYCTFCMKLAFDIGITYFVLLRADGICQYDMANAIKLSYDFGCVL